VRRPCISKRIFAMVSKTKVICCLLLLGYLTACSVAPEPLSVSERESRAAVDLEIIHSKRYVPVESISLYDAMARAVAFNLQHSVRQIERDIAELELEQANQEGFPDVSATGGRTRDSETVSSGTDRNIRTGSFGATWSLLDLGVSYARAKQSADRVMIAEERRRKGLQDIIRSVRLAYWKAVGAQQLMTRMVAIERDFSTALAESRRLEVTNVETRRRTVGFRRGLIDTVRQLIAARKEYGRAKLEFAQLINVRPGVKFTLKLPETEQGVPAMPMPIEEMEAFALDNRPELRVEDYNERISEWESREALYGMFPGLDFDLARNFSSDSGLANGAWNGVGATLGMNLFRVFSGALSMDTAAMRGEMARRQRLAMSVAVLAQVYIASQEYREANYQFRLARQISHSDNELSKLAVAERRITNGNMLDVVDVAARQLRSEVDQHRAYVELRRSHGDVLHALGLDAIPSDIPLDDVNALRVAIQNTMAKWETLAEDTDPANDGSIEDLVGKVLADMDGMGPSGPGPMTVADIDQPDLVVATVPALEEQVPVAELLTAVEPPVTVAPVTGASGAKSLEMRLAKIGEGAVKTPFSTDGPVQGQLAVVADLPLPDGVIAVDAAPVGDAKASITKLAAVEMAENNRRQVHPPAPGQQQVEQKYDVQFGAFKELPRAQGLLAALREGNRFPNTANAGRRFQIVDKQGADDQVLFHVQLGADFGRSAAKTECAAFLAHGQKCAVVRRSTVRRASLAGSTDVAIAGATEQFNAIGASSEPVRAKTVLAEAKSAKAEPEPSDEAFDEVAPRSSPTPGVTDAGELMLAMETRAELDARQRIAPPIPSAKRVLPNYEVQFGAFNELPRAQGLLEELQNTRRPSGPNDAGRRFHIVEKQNPDKQVLFHVQFGAYLGWTAARIACDGFARLGENCVVVRHRLAMGKAKNQLAASNSAANPL